jgi:hypothetical protein
MNAPDRKYPDLPRDIEAEAQFIGVLFWRNVDLPALLPMVAREDFSEEVHALIYDGVLQLVAKGEAVSPLSIRAVIGEHALAGGMTVGAYLADLIANAEHPSQGPTLAGLVKQAANARRLVQIGYRIERDWQTSNRERLIGDSLALVSSIKETAGGAKAAIPGGFIHDLLREVPKRDWIVKKALLARSFSLIVGPPGCGKSFLALDLAMNLALAAVDPTHSGQWFGNTLKPSGVVYIAAEGQEDFIIRIHAWLAAKGLPVGFRMPFFLIPTAIDMRTDALGTDALIRVVKDASAVCCKEFGVDVSTVFIDTVNRSLAGGDDSKADHIGAFIGNSMRLKEACNVTALGITHTIKAGGTVDPRGHGSLKGDNDGQWFVRAAEDGAPNSFTITRLKSGATGASHEFRLRRQVVGADAEGQEEDSLVVIPLASRPSVEEHEMRDAADALSSRQANMTSDGRAIVSDRLVVVMRALVEATQREGSVMPPGVRAPHGTKAATIKLWREEIARKLPGKDDEDHARTNKQKRASETLKAAMEKLQVRGLIGVDEDWVWRTSRRVAGVDAKNSDVRGDYSAAPPDYSDAPSGPQAATLDDDPAFPL